MDPAEPTLSRVFFTTRRRRLVTRDEEGEEAEDEVEVMEPGFCEGRGADAELFGGAARLLRFPIEPRSFPRPPRDSGSEHGFRNGERLSLSRQKTTAIEPPTTEPPAPLPGPPVPSRSMPSFPEEPVVLLTPSRTRTDTLDWSLPFLLLPSFLDLLERPSSFRLPLSRVLSLTLRARLTPGSAEEMGSDERFLLFVLADSEFFLVAFLLSWLDLEAGFALGLGRGKGGGAGGGVSSSEG